MTIHVVHRDEGEILVVGPMSIRILEDGSRTDGRLGLVEVTLPPQASGPPQHLHREHDETFFVVSGQPTFMSGTDEITLRPGTLLTAPIGAPHTFANPGAEPAVMLCTVTPDRYIGYFRELAVLIGPAGGGFDAVPVGEIMARYATEIVHR